MNSLEAKFILEACRSVRLDESDPKIAEALRMMESDPELAQWFAASQEYDRTVIAKLKSVPVPEDLAERILAGRALEHPSPGRGSMGRWLALAALVIVLATLAALLIPRSRPGDIVTFRHDMEEFMDRGWDRTFDLSDPEFAKVKLWLESRNSALRIKLPAALATSPTLGCKNLDWHGNTATLICFLPKDAGTVVHILMVDRRALTDAPGEQPQLARLTRWNSAIWTSGDKVYLALTKAEPNRLTDCL